MTPSRDECIHICTFSLDVFNFAEQMAEHWYCLAEPHKETVHPETQKNKQAQQKDCDKLSRSEMRFRAKLEVGILIRGWK